MADPVARLFRHRGHITWSPRLKILQVDTPVNYTALILELPDRGWHAYHAGSQPPRRHSHIDPCFRCCHHYPRRTSPPTSPWTTAAINIPVTATSSAHGSKQKRQRLVFVSHWLTSVGYFQRIPYKPSVSCLLRTTFLFFMYSSNGSPQSSITVLVSPQFRKAYYYFLSCKTQG